MNFPIRHGMVCFMLCFLFFSTQSQTWKKVNRGIEFKEAGRFFNDTVDNQLYIGGFLKYLDSVEVNGIGRFDGKNSFTLGTGMNNCFNYCQIGRVIAKYQNMIYIETGSEEYLDSTSVHGIAAWNGTRWDTVGGGVRYISSGDTVSGGIRDMKVRDNKLYVCGNFHLAGNTRANTVAIWDGSNWYGFDTITNWEWGSDIRGLEVYQGEIYICGNFENPDGTINNIAKWNGTNWVGLTEDNDFNAGGWIYEMEVYKDFLYVAGHFSAATGAPLGGNNILRWDGSNWHSLGGGVYNPGTTWSQVHDLQVFNGKLYVIGTFNYAGGIKTGTLASWDGQKWCSFDTTTMFNSPQLSIGYLNDTVYISATNFNFDSSLNRFAKWDGSLEPIVCSEIVAGEQQNSSYEHSMSIYPNPTLSQLNLAVSIPLTDNYEISIIDNLGKNHMKFYRKLLKGEQKLIWDVSSLPDGIYILRLTGNAGKFNFNSKFIKVK